MLNLRTISLLKAVLCSMNSRDGGPIIQLRRYINSSDFFLTKCVHFYSIYQNFHHTNPTTSGIIRRLLCILGCKHVFIRPPQYISLWAFLQYCTSPWNVSNTYKVRVSVFGKLKITLFSKRKIIHISEIDFY